MRGARFERAVRDSRPATAAKRSYRRRASPAGTLRSRSWRRTASLSRRRRLSEQHYEHRRQEQRASAAR